MEKPPSGTHILWICWEHFRELPIDFKAKSPPIGDKTSRDMCRSHQFYPPIDPILNIDFQGTVGISWIKLNPLFFGHLSIFESF
jgi:hypothetical protein